MWDVHAHVIPQEVLDAAQSGLYDLSLEGEWLIIDKRRVLVRHLASLEGLARYAEKFGLSLVLSVPPALLRDDERSPGWHRFLNEAMDSARRRLAVASQMLAVLPLASVKAALGEWHRVQDRALGLVMGSDINQKLVGHPDFEPFWRNYAKAGGGLAFIHGHRAYDARLNAYYLDNLVGFPGEDTLATAALVFSGLPLDYPQIQWCVSHGGGGAAMLLGRWQRGYDTHRPGIDTSRPSPREIFQRLWFDSVVHDPRALSYLLSMAPRRVVFGTDYPFPMGMQHQLEAGQWSQSTMQQIATNTENLMKTVTKGRTIL